MIAAAKAGADAVDAALDSMSGMYFFRFSCCERSEDLLCICLVSSLPFSWLDR